MCRLTRLCESSQKPHLHNFYIIAAAFYTLKFAGESSQAKTDETETECSDLRKRHRENEKTQLSESSHAKRAKTLPKIAEDQKPTNAEVNFSISHFHCPLR